MLPTSQANGCRFSMQQMAVSNVNVSNLELCDHAFLSPNEN